MRGTRLTRGASGARRFAATLVVSVVVALGALVSPSTSHAGVPVTLYQAFAGDVNFRMSGGTLRSAPNSGAGANACSLAASGSNPLTGVPAGSTVLAAYLYWAGSGSTVDSTVTLNGVTVNASRTFTETFVNGGTNYDFFSGFADVTAQVAATGNGTYTVAGLSVDNGAPYCGVQAVLAGWSLVVVYENSATERTRVLNVFDGFQFFRGSAINLTLANFRASASPDGSLSVITWEGDSENSGSLGGFTESLVFNGTTLTDGFNPSNNQFNSTVNGIGDATTWGVDVDTYDVSALVNQGDLSASSVYSSGADLVLLTAQVAAFSSDPLVDLSVTKSHTGDFVAGTTGDYTIAVANAGPLDDPALVTVTDTLPAGLTYVAGSGTGWTCGASGQDVTCTNPGPVPAGGALPDLTLTVAVDEAAIPGVDNTVNVATGSYDATPGNDTATDSTVVRGPDLSTSTKSVVDLNGGDAEPGDVLRYTVTLIETAGLAATGVQVTDDIPALLENLTIVSVPPGATNSSTGAGTGAFGAGFVDIGAISVPAGGTATVVFDVTVIASASAGDIIANTAVVSNPNGADASPAAPDVTVSASSVPATGTKPLYLYDAATGDPNGFNTGPRPYLSRTPPAGAQSNIRLLANTSAAWTMTPATAAPLTLGSGVVPVTLWLSKAGSGGSAAQRTVTVSLASIGTTTGPIGTPVSLTIAAPPSTTPAEFRFDVPLAADVTLGAGSQVVLTVANANNRTRVFPVGPGGNSRVDLPALTVIDVGSVAFFDAPFPGGSPVPDVDPGTTVYARAVVSDPFGSFDINPLTQPTLDITDPGGAPVVTGQIMTEVADSGAATKTFETTWAVPATAVEGAWTARVTAYEGTEGNVSHSRAATVAVVRPDLLVTKLSQVISDPFSGTTNPKAIPGAVVLYTITVTNQGAGRVDNDSLVIEDPLQPGNSLYVDTSGGDPVVFVDGAVPSGLGFSYASDVAFSNQPGGGPPYTYAPTPDAEGFDPQVTGLRVAPSGTMAGAYGPAPGFQVRLRIRIDQP